MFAIVAQYTEDELAAAVRSVEQKFSDDVEHIRFTVHEDWSDDPAIFTRVLLKDKPALMKKAERLDENSKAAFAITTRISSELRAALDEFHLPVYFAFRWASEQRQLRDADWE